MPSLRDVRQSEAIRAFIRMGGTERSGKGSHRVVDFHGVILSFPKGILKIGLLKRLLARAGVTEDEFVNHL